MNMGRWFIAVTVSIALAALFIWQRQRHQLIETCVIVGGAWSGTTSKCIPLPGPPVIQRDIRRI